MRQWYILQSLPTSIIAVFITFMAEREGFGLSSRFASSLQSRRLLPLLLQSVFSNPVKYAPTAYFTKFTRINDYRIQYLYGGEGGIWTLETDIICLLDFESSAFNHSATSPVDSINLFIDLMIVCLSWRREGDSNPRGDLRRPHAFQACAFNRSAISPKSVCLILNF